MTNYLMCVRHPGSFTSAYPPVTTSPVCFLMTTPIFASDLVEALRTNAATVN